VALMVLAGVVGVGPAAWATGAPGLAWPLLITQQPVPAGLADAPAAERARRRPVDGGPGTRLVVLHPDGALRPLVPGFAWAGQPSLSADGERVLFAGRKQPSEPRAIWEVGVDGSGLRRVTEGPGDCLQPEHMSRNALDAPGFVDRVGWFAYLSDAAGELEPLGGGGAWHLYARTLQPASGRGVVTWRTSFQPGSALSPTMLQDGRLLYSQWAHYGDGPPPDRGGRFGLMAMNWAGTGLNAVYGMHREPWLKHMAAELPDRTLVFVESAGEHADGSGRLAQISWRRPLHTHQVVGEPGVRYRDPRALPDGRLLVARRAADESSFGLVVYDRGARRVEAQVYDDPAWDDVDAVAVAPRDEPMGRIATVWDERFSTGALACINVYDSSLPEVAQLAEGSVRSVRVLQALPASTQTGSGAPAYDPRQPFGASADLRVRVLGEIPVMPDGSFHVTLPADTPVSFQILDRDGVALRTMRSWIWLRPWNRRTCVGCHADPEVAPPNRAPAAVASALLPSLDLQHARRATDYVHDVAPILRARCGEACHGPKLLVQEVPERRPVLDGWRDPPYDRAYRSLVPRYVVPGRARDSELVRLLRPAPGQPGHAGLLPAELATLAAWIDLGAQWDATQYTVPVPPVGPGGRGEPGGGAGVGAGGAAPRRR